MSNDDFDYECAAINRAVDRFAAAMREKMIAKAREGFRGWNDPQNKAMLRAGLEEHLHKDRVTSKQMPDIGNYSMMLWLIEQIEDHACQYTKADYYGFCQCIICGNPIHEDAFNTSP